MRIFPRKWIAGALVVSALMAMCLTASANAIKPWAILTDLNQRFVFYPDAANTNSDLVLDRSTGLIWTRNILNPPGPVSSFEADNFCDEFNAGGVMGFRLPKAEELTSIATVSSGQLSWIGAPYFNGVGPSTLTSFWSSSFYYFIDSGAGDPLMRRTTKTVTAGPIQASVDLNDDGDRSPRARCVRGGTN